MPANLNTALADTKAYKEYSRIWSIRLAPIENLVHQKKQQDFKFIL